MHNIEKEKDFLVLSYGSERVPSRFAEDLADDPAGNFARPGAPIVALTPWSGNPLRMSELKHLFALPPRAQDMSHANTQLSCLERHVGQLCGLWNKPLTRFSTAYFNALRHSVNTDGSSEERAGSLAGLVEPQHWCFAAPMPMPRAHLGIDSDGSLAGSGAQNIIRIDMLFQDSIGLLALELGGGSRTPNRQKDLESLEAAGVRVLALPDLPSTETLLDSLGPDFRHFADGVSLPQSPFRGQGIQAPTF